MSVFVLMTRRPPNSPLSSSSAASDVYKRQEDDCVECMAQLPYLHATVTEALRLHPSVPLELKTAMEDDELPDGTKVQAGNLVIFSPYAMNRDERMWENPEEFRPERWLNDEGGGFVDKSQYAFPSFNAGPRLCLGKGLAYLEVKMFTTMLLDEFDFEQPGEGHSGAYLSTVTMPIQGGLPMRAIARAQSAN
eukprot:TRINITY_DN21152_c0_g1_i1.p2 TRINITY_DN21152_c0_g1~~TRINITY_DN21152_c0_g1_i1.p2  ORF type:complete len:192 (-),score=49.00 TRINITY_DN21152_c0_g1_i1:49-624(-)